MGEGGLDKYQKEGRVGVGGLVTDTWVVSEGGCASAASEDLRSGAPHTILSYPILSYQGQTGHQFHLNKRQRVNLRIKR